MNTAGQSLQCLLPLMKARGVTVAPAQFHEAVNLTYHRFEAASYDTGHAEMWESLPQQFTLLTGDLLAHTPTLPDALRVLDVGCGTGLSSTLILRSALGPRIASIDLVDTAPEMLERCAIRAAEWGVPHRLTRGTIEVAPADTYDLILVSSVLHHIPDLAGFMHHIRRLQPARGWFMHIQDPNGDHLRDPDLLRRMDLARTAMRRRPPTLAHRALAPLRFAGRVLRRFAGSQPEEQPGFLRESVNAELLRTGIIQSPMSDEEIWSVTDIHVDGLPYSTCAGISLRALGGLLPGYRLVAQRSYAFFGKMLATLPEQFRAEELALIEKGAPDGKQIGAIWERSS